MLLLCRTHKNEVVEEILDLMLSFSDFLTFKQTMLSYKAVRTPLLSLPLSLSPFLSLSLSLSLPLPFCYNDVFFLVLQAKEGTAVDLSSGLIVTSLSPKR